MLLKDARIQAEHDFDRQSRDQNCASNLDISTKFSTLDYRRFKAKTMPKNILQFNNIHVEYPFWVCSFVFSINIFQPELSVNKISDRLKLLLQGQSKCQEVTDNTRHPWWTEIPGGLPRVDYCTMLVGLMVQRKHRQNSKWGFLLSFWTRGKIQRLIDIMWQNNWMHTWVTSKALFSFFIVH